MEGQVFIHDQSLWSLEVQKYNFSAMQCQKSGKAGFDEYCQNDIFSPVAQHLTSVVRDKKPEISEFMSEKPKN